MLKKIIKANILLAVILSVFVVSGCQNKEEYSTVEINVSQIETTTTATSSVKEVETSTIPKDKPKPKTEIKVPSDYLLPVLFSQQAPFANWDAIHEETCEEASMIMAVKYFNKQPLNESIMENEIQELLGWQEKGGYKVDLTADETAYILNNYYKINATTTSEVTVDRIKYEISKGNLILVPVAGRELDNPNFKTPGPIYHMLVIKGYNESEFITNDPGTRKGNGFKYTYSNLLDSVHDWDHQLALGGMTDEEISQGEKVMIIVSGNN